MSGEKRKARMKERRSKNYYWLTPPWIVEAARESMGSIKLDPCANSSNNVGATESHFTGDPLDGLREEWFGTIFMNPPYGSEIEKWAKKWRSEFELKRAVAGIALIPSRTDTQWWQDFFHTADAICFIEGRVSFLRPGKTEETPSMFPSAVIFATNRPDIFPRENFISSFFKYGGIVAPVYKTGDNYGR
jgi:phage N-6-adenine-methyltransferase